MAPHHALSLPAHRTSLACWALTANLTFPTTLAAAPHKPHQTTKSHFLAIVQANTSASLPVVSSDMARETNAGLVGWFQPSPNPHVLCSCCRSQKQRLNEVRATSKSTAFKSKVAEKSVLGTVLQPPVLSCGCASLSALACSGAPTVCSPASFLFPSGLQHQLLCADIRGKVHFQNLCPRVNKVNLCFTAAFCWGEDQNTTHLHARRMATPGDLLLHLPLQ